MACAAWVDYTRWPILFGAIGLAALASAADDATYSHGVYEVQYLASNTHNGDSLNYTWFEGTTSLSDRFSTTISNLTFGPSHMLDEAFIRYLDPKGPMLRAGRIRSQFGFADWSELEYSGINHSPISRSRPLADRYSLTRFDSGVEATLGGPGLQLQAGLVDPQISPEQYLPSNLNSTNVRLQSSLRDVMVGANLFSDLANNQKMYGLDARWTMPLIQLKGEVMRGTGGSLSAGGYYLDGHFRFSRAGNTQLVGRIEGYRVFGASSQTFFRTLAVRKVLSKNVTASLNYGWGNGSTASLHPGWSLATLFQLPF